MSHWTRNDYFFCGSICLAVILFLSLVAPAIWQDFRKDFVEITPEQYKEVGAAAREYRMLNDSLFNDMYFDGKVSIREYETMMHTKKNMDKLRSVLTEK